MNTLLRNGLVLIQKAHRRLREKAGLVSGLADMDLPKGMPVHPGDRIRLGFTRKERPGWAWRWKATVSPP